MPTVSDLGRMVKQKYPQYADIPDLELGRKVKAKYSEYGDYQDVPDVKPDQQPTGETFLGEIGKGIEGAANTAALAARVVAHPARAFPDVQAAVSGILGASLDQFAKAKEAYSQGRYSEAFGHLLGSAPVVGPPVAEAGEAIGGTSPKMDKFGNVVEPGAEPNLGAGLGKAVVVAAPLAVKPIAGATRPGAAKASEAAGRLKTLPTSMAPIELADFAPVAQKVLSGNTVGAITEVMKLAKKAKRAAPETPPAAATAEGMEASPSALAPPVEPATGQVTPVKAGYRNGRPEIRPVDDGSFAAAKRNALRTKAEAPATEPAKPTPPTERALTPREEDATRARGLDPQEEPPTQIETANPEVAPETPQLTKPDVETLKRQLKEAIDPEGKLDPPKSESSKATLNDQFRERNRALKVRKVVEMLNKWKISADDAEAMTDAHWKDLEKAAGVRASSAETRQAVLAVLKEKPPEPIQIVKKSPFPKREKQPQPLNPDPEAEAPASTRPNEREYSSTQVNLGGIIGKRMKQAAARVPDSELALEGREVDPHITVKYGLHGEDVESVRKLLENEEPVRVKLGKSSLFENDDADVLKVEVESDGLRRLNEKIAKLPNSDKHPEYKPHATIAYLRPGSGKKYAGKPVPGVSGKEVVIDRLTFSGKNGERVEILLGGETKAAPTATIQPKPETKAKTAETPAATKRSPFPKTVKETPAYPPLPVRERAKPELVVEGGEPIIFPPKPKGAPRKGTP